MNNFTKQLSNSLGEFATAHSEVVSGVSGYWEFIGNPITGPLANESVSADRHTMISTVSFQKDASLKEVEELTSKLDTFGRDHDSSDISVGCTGLFALFGEVTKVMEQQMVIIDGVVLPIAILILGCNIRSYRHMIIALCNLGCTLLLGFSILLPIAGVKNINTFGPSIMMSLGIAVCFDYSLFMLTRFREEVIVNGKTRDEAVLTMLCASGHVIILSGCTIFFTFTLLLAFPQNFLQSVGWSCGCVVFAAIVTNMSVTPCFLLRFECFGRFDLCPRFSHLQECLPCIFGTAISKPSPSQQDVIPAGGSYFEGIEQGQMYADSTAVNGDEKPYAPQPSSGCPSGKDSTTDTEPNSPIPQQRKRVSAAGVTVTGDHVLTNIQSVPDIDSNNDVAAQQRNSPYRVVVIDSQTHAYSNTPSVRAFVQSFVYSFNETAEEKAAEEVTDRRRKMKRNLWFFAAYFFTRHPIATVLIASGIAIVLALQFARIVSALLYCSDVLVTRFSPVLDNYFWNVTILQIETHIGYRPRIPAQLQDAEHYEDTL